MHIFLTDLETQHRRLADKRRGTMMIDPLPSKKQRSTPTGKRDDGGKKERSFSQLMDPHKLLTSQQVNKLHNQGGANAASNKVVKWEEYLQRVRAGIRSAPNSPTSSPKIKRGSCKGANNFMVNNKLQRSKPQQPVSPAKSAIVAPIVAVKQAKPKKSIELERFEQYMAKLRDKEHGKKPAKKKIEKKTVADDQITADESSNHAVVSDADQLQPAIQPDLSLTSATSKGGTKVITFTDSKTNRKISVKMEKKPTDVFPAISSSGIKPNNKLVQVIATATTSISNPTSVSKGTSTSSPKPSKTRRVYKTATSAAASRKARKVYKTATATAKHDNNSQTYFTIESSGKVHTATVTPVNSSSFANDPRKGMPADIRLQSQQPAVLQTIPYDKWKKETSAKNPTAKTLGKDHSNPTFKLVAANPNGNTPSKSLILSGVTGQLKDILTLLSKQQQNQVSAHDQFV